MEAANMVRIVAMLCTVVAVAVSITTTADPTTQPAKQLPEDEFDVWVTDLLRKAIDGDSEAMGELFAISVHTDGASTEVLEDPYLVILVTAGERSFVKELKKQPKRVRDKVLRIMGDYIDRRSYERICRNSGVEPQPDQGHHMKDGYWYVPPMPDGR